MFPLLLGGGLSVLGSIFNSRAANKQANQQNAIIQSELGRRNYLQDMLMPMLLRQMGIRRPYQPLNPSAHILGQSLYTKRGF